ncbi:3918_t:CDS:2 [Funneliformis geosporum]|uniref:3918_t:CDS:1 n=1 Tax=Funneliformis geosporum TaxID=1117311 RepID=A0A9W4WN20_9GLOM|nr:3918_t:CDS:2 [Funneliformis geosporum]
MQSGVPLLPTFNHEKDVKLRLLSYRNSSTPAEWQLTDYNIMDKFQNSIKADILIYDVNIAVFIRNSLPDHGTQKLWMQQRNLLFSNGYYCFEISSHDMVDETIRQIVKLSNILVTGREA